MWDLVGNPEDRFSHNEAHTISRGTTYTGLSGHFFAYFESKSICFDVVIFDLVHDVRAMHGIC